MGRKEGIPETPDTAFSQHRLSDDSDRRHRHSGHDHSHAQLHGHTHAIDHLNRAFGVGILLNVAYVAAELFAGFRIDSMALISDAGHNLSDVVSLVLSMLAFRLMSVKPNSRFTYGYKKSTVLVSLLNACILLVAVGLIVAESVVKLKEPRPIEGDAIAWVAGVGIAVNAFTAWLFMKDRKRDLNVRGAFLHMVADALVSVGVVVSGIVIGFTGWYLLDPIIGLLVAVVILVSTASLLLDSLRLSLDGVPAGCDPDRLRREIMTRIPEVKDLHHIHVWAISTTENALTAHVVTEDGEMEYDIKCRVKKLLSDEGITHATLEFERPGENCTSCNCL